MPSDEHAELRGDLASLKADFREAVASIRGSIDTLAATKAGEVKDLSTQVSDVRHDHRSTKLSVSALHDRLDKYPDPDHLQKTLDRLGSKLDTLATHDDVRKLENDLAAYPKPENVKAGIELAEKNQLTLVRMAAAVLGAGGVGGVAAQLLGQVLLGA